MTQNTFDEIALALAGLFETILKLPGDTRENLQELAASLRSVADEPQDS